MLQKEMSKEKTQAARQMCSEGKSSLMSKGRTVDKCAGRKREWLMGTLQRENQLDIYRKDDRQMHCRERSRLDVKRTDSHWNLDVLQRDVCLMSKK